MLAWFIWLPFLWADGGYTGTKFSKWVNTRRPKLKLGVFKRSDARLGFKVRLRRLVIEHTFGRLLHHHRLVLNYETTLASAKVLLDLAMICIQLRRLTCLSMIMNFKTDS